MSQLPYDAAQAIDADDVASLATGLCNIASDRDNEGAIAEHIARRLERSGIEVHLEEVVAGRPNVVARVPGTDGGLPPLVLNGHLDGAFHVDGWRRDALAGWVEGDRLYGGAVSDMKGGLASMVVAMETAARLGGTPRDLILQAVMHHDTVGLGTKYLLASEGPTEGYAICGEPSNLSIHVANGGAVKFSIAVKGRASHISRLDEGIDALASAVGVYSGVASMAFTHQAHPSLPDLPIVLVGVLQAGFAAGCTAPEATLLGDVRTVPGMDRHTVRADLRRIIDQHLSPDTTCELRITAAQKSFIGNADSPLVAALRTAHTRIRGAAPAVGSPMPGQAFVTDAADLAAIGLDSAVYGPGDWHYAPDEWVSITDLRDAAAIYLATAYELPHSP
ncbi:M20 family metallopeptidase [Dactylosporangium sucinum]|uniref:Acetylornithine deacetylase n=1 Tax=Dactylosporangium sucinum TaxID=1424081 RepID=A0A917U6A3_9ACTN|nr:M20/M25/M40 family metallo-hydrolase [Dactylosporangium sucinum]GGM61921.1 acetylornithine deacetylase [Dactylosporangium sucinum]